MTDMIGRHIENNLTLRARSSCSGFNEKAPAGAFFFPNTGIWFVNGR